MSDITIVILWFDMIDCVTFFCNRITDYITVVLWLTFKHNVQDNIIVN